jgi:hypothetical protein
MKRWQQQQQLLLAVLLVAVVFAETLGEVELGLMVGHRGWYQRLYLMIPRQMRMRGCWKRALIDLKMLDALVAIHPSRAVSQWRRR